MFWLEGGTKILGVWFGFFGEFDVDDAEDLIDKAKVGREKLLQQGVKVGEVKISSGLSV